MNVQIKILKKHYTASNGEKKYSYQLQLLFLGKTLAVKQVFDKDYAYVCRLAEDNPNIVTEILEK